VPARDRTEGLADSTRTTSPTRGVRALLLEQARGRGPGGEIDWAHDSTGTALPRVFAQRAG
jgi:hypothetical protein